MEHIPVPDEPNHWRANIGDLKYLLLTIIDYFSKFSPNAIIQSDQGFWDNNRKTENFDFENDEIKYDERIQVVR